MSGKKVATHVRDTCEGKKVFRMSPPLDGHEHVIVSAANALLSGPETYIFGCDKDGRVVDWSELDGSFKGGLSHDQALRNAGYVAVYEDA